MGPIVGSIGLGQEFARLGEMLTAAGVGEQTVVADEVEAAGQDVLCSRKRRMNSSTPRVVAL